MSNSWVTIAIPTGRPLQPTLLYLQRLGIQTDVMRKATNRRLVFEDTEHQIRYVLCKPSAVPYFVEMGAADLGFLGSDILLESRPNTIELLDLQYLQCRLVLAAPESFNLWILDDPNQFLRVATKFPRLAQEHLQRFPVTHRILYVPGSVEAAVELGVADVVCDLVETGQTLQDNGLVEIETLVECSCRLIANPHAMKDSSVAIQAVLDKFIQAVRSV